MRTRVDFIAALICAVSLTVGCATPISPPVKRVEPPMVAPGSEGPYFYFLAAQKERRNGKVDQAIVHLRKAIELEPDSSYLQRELATVYLQNKEEQNALEVLDRLLTDHPDDTKALILTGGIRQMRKETAAAIEAFEKAIRLDPSEEKIFSLLGGIYLEADDIANAERVLRELIDRFPQSYAGHFLLGRIHLLRKETASAEKEFRRAADLEPESIEPLFELLKIYREQGRSVEMLRVNQLILERDPDNSRAFLEMALHYRKSGMKPEAAAVLKELGEKSRTEFEVVLQVVQLYVDPKNYTDALFLIEGMLKGAPNNPDLHYLKGFCLFGLKKNEEALAEFRMVPPDSRFFNDATVHSAFVLQEQGKSEEALELLTAASEKNPQNVELKYYLGSIYEEAGRLAEAETALRQAIEADPENARYHFRLGVVLDKQNNKTASIEAMRKVIAIDPKNANALNYLGYTYADLGENLDEAEQLILEAMKYKPGDGYITDSLGWVYYKKGDYRRAMEMLKKAADLVPGDPAILEHIGDTYLKLGDKTNALKYYQRALAKKEKDKGELIEKIRRLKESGR